MKKFTHLIYCRYPYANITKESAYQFMEKGRVAAEQKQVTDRAQERPRDFSEQGVQPYGEVPAVSSHFYCSCYAETETVNFFLDVTIQL